VVRIALWLLAIIGGIPVALLCAGCVWIYFATNWHPPDQFVQLFSRDHLTHLGEVDATITEILDREFPTGTSVSDLKSGLYKKGFRELPPPPTGCLPSDEKAKELGLHPPYAICPDTHNVMAYRWAIGLVCGASIYVRWSSNQNSQIDRIKGTANTGCL
jgi:hypothetical protein